MNGEIYILVGTFRKLFVIIIFLFVLFKVIAKNLSEEEIKGLKQMFRNIDTDQSGTITYEELKTGLARLGSRLSEPEVRQLMDAVRFSTIIAPLPIISVTINKFNHIFTGRRRPKWNN